jgi:4-oxalocrotonate tautomerase
MTMCVSSASVLLRARLISSLPSQKFRGDVMPVVIVEMWQGRNEDQKAKVIRGISKAFEEIGVPAEHIHVIIHDVPKCNWGVCGEPASKTNP